MSRSPATTDPSFSFTFERDTQFWIGLAYHEMTRAMAKQLAPLDLTVRQVQVLALILLDGDVCQTDLAERLPIEASTLVGVLDRMERDGWIVRQPCPSDRRKKLVRPAARVAPVWDVVVEAGLAVRSRALQGVSARDRQVAERVLARMVRNLHGDPGAQI